jgi:hypothetical protein
MQDHWQLITESGAAHPGRVHVFVDTIASYNMPATAVAVEVGKRIVEAAAATNGGLQCLIFCTTCDQVEKTAKDIR